MATGNHQTGPVEPPGTPEAPPRTSIPALLVQAGIVTPEQVRYAERIQGKLVTPKPLLQLLKELKYVSDAQLREVLQSNRVSMPLGELLVELGLLRPSDLAAALGMQKGNADGRRLGQILVEQRFVDEQKLIEALSYQMGFAAVDPLAAQVDAQLLEQAPLAYYSKHGILPLRVENGQVVVAFSDPLDAQQQEAARRIFGTKVTPAIARASAIQAALQRMGRLSANAMPSDEDADETAVGLVKAIIDDAVDEGASDIHVEPLADRLRVRFRIDGVLVHKRDLPLAIAPAIASRIKVMSGANIAERRRHQDGRMYFEHSGGTLDLRVSVYVTIHGEKIVLRLLNRRRELLSFEDLGMSPGMLERFREEAVEAPGGVVIITGPTGSGKTTTLYTCIDHINKNDIAIVTAEDPVEYMMDGVAQCSINAKLNLTFEETLRHIVRQDPDVIVIGEIRDSFSAEVSIQAALTGHKVFTTFHTEDSIGGLLRLLNMEIEAFLISSTVVSVLAQRLVRRLCHACAVEQAPNPTRLRRLGYPTQIASEVRWLGPRGCPRCRFTGYKGRVGVYELLVLNEVVRDALIQRRTSFEIRKIGTETTGLVTLLEDGILKAAQGLTSLDEVIENLPQLARPRPLVELRRLSGE